MSNNLQQFYKSLSQNNILNFEDISNILDAFQIASGQTYAINKTKILLDFINNGNSIIIDKFNNTEQKKIISSSEDLANIFKSIDHFIDLKEINLLKKYF